MDRPRTAVGYTVFLMVVAGLAAYPQKPRVASADSRGAEDADIAVTIDDHLTTARAGTALTYEINVINLGPAGIPAGLVVTAAVPPGTIGSESQPDCQVSSVFQCTTSATLDVGAALPYFLTLHLSPKYPAGTSVQTTVAVTFSPLNDPNAANDSATDFDSVEPFQKPPRLPPPPAADWLSIMNYYRAMAKAPAVTEEPSWSDGCWKHARYIVKTDQLGHSEDPSSPWYTPEGAAAATGNQVASTGHRAIPQSAFDSWMTGPFHALAIIDPWLERTGFGLYWEPNSPGYRWAACVDVHRGYHAPLSPSDAPPSFSWPGDGASVAHSSFDGLESPNPLAYCPGYSPPTGLPISTTFRENAVLTNHSFFSQGASVDHCAFAYGRSVILIPSKRLRVGVTYTASVTANGDTTSWIFTVVESRPPETRIGSPLHRETYDRDRLRRFRGRATDGRGSGVTLVEVALKQRMRRGGCRWWNGETFIPGPCGEALWITAKGTDRWRYRLPGPLPTSTGRSRVSWYELRARARDADENQETTTPRGRNLVRFELAP